MSELASVPIIDKNGKATTVRRKLSQVFSMQRKLPTPVVTSAPVAAIPSTPLIKPFPLTDDESSAWLTSVNFDTEFQHYARNTHNSIARLERDTQALVKELIEDRGLSVGEVVRLMNAIDVVTPLSRKYELDHDIMLVVGELQAQGRLKDKADYAGMLIMLMGINAKLSGKKQHDRISSQEELLGKAALTYALTRWRVGTIPDSANYILNSPSLTSYVFDHPKELDRVLAYFDERGMRSESDFEGFLDSLYTPASAVQGGWL